jgi:beta-glucosidase-like glycosyl hydrolase
VERSPKEQIDRSVLCILRLTLQLGLFDDPSSTPSRPSARITTEDTSLTWRINRRDSAVRETERLLLVKVDRVSHPASDLRNLVQMTYLRVGSEVVGTGG